MWKLHRKEAGALRRAGRGGGSSAADGAVDCSREARACGNLGESEDGYLRTMSVCVEMARAS